MVNFQNTTASSRIACRACGSVAAAPGRHANGFDVVLCRDCGLGYVPPAQLSAAVDYDKLYENDGAYGYHVNEAATLEAGRLVESVRSRRVALEEIRQMKPASLLEVGCGVG